MNSALRCVEVDSPGALRKIICDHRLKKTRHPVRSAISKLQIARLVLRWVTTRESLVLQVILFTLQYEGST